MLDVGSVVLSSPSPNPKPPCPTDQEATENVGEIHDAEVVAFGTT